MLSWFQALMPKEDRFFDLFARHSTVIVAGAEALQRLLEGGEDVPRFCREIKERENEADEITREVLLAVRRTFITPFDRGDIKDLINSMDDAIDQMHQTAKAITLFELRSFDPIMREMGQTIVEAAHLTAKAVPLLSSLGTQSSQLIALTEDITRMEERSDDLYDDGLKNLFRTFGSTDPMAFTIGSEIYGNLERVSDAFDDVANEIHGLVIEHV
jgi:predicted phosphate transport protein (TIGR00153 family)